MILNWGPVGQCRQGQNRSAASRLDRVRGSEPAKHTMRMDRAELAEDHDFHVKVLARFPSEWHNALPAKLFQEMWFQTQLTAA
jgi:hypothetical protein